MRQIVAPLAGIALLSLGACSAMFGGTTQQIMVNTNPAGAECGLYRQGTRIGMIASTPGAALVDKTKHDITILCIKPGFEQLTWYNRSGADANTAVNAAAGLLLLPLAPIGWAIDSASGADNKYESPVNITMVPLPPGAIAASATLPASLPPTPAPASAAVPSTDAAQAPRP
jgi:hypothetical protein